MKISQTLCIHMSILHVLRLPNYSEIRWVWRSICALVNASIHEFLSRRTAASLKLPPFTILMFGLTTLTCSAADFS